MGSRPKVLVFIKGLGIGGAERLVTEAADHWDRDRFEYRVAYVLPWKDQLVAELVRRGIEVDMLGGTRGSSVRAGLAMRALVQATGTDLVHAHLPSAGIVARVFAPAPVVYTEHNIVDSYRRATRIANRLTYGRNAAVTAVSPAVAQALAGYPGPEAQVVDNGVSVDVDVDQVQRVREELELGPTQRLVVHVGNIRPHKGHANLVAMAKWIAEREEDVVIVSVGGEKYPGDLDRVRALAHEQGLDGRLRFLGRRPEARAFLAAADVVVNPSDFEGLPVTLLEAMALGRPIAATAVGGVPELIETEVTGLLVPPSDPVALGGAVQRLLHDPELYRSLSANGLVLVEKRYGIASMVRSFEEIYSRVLGV